MSHQTVGVDVDAHPRMTEKRNCRRAPVGHWRGCGIG